MYKKRLIAFAAVLAVLFTGIALRVGWLTKGEWSTAAEQQAGYTLTVARCRGTIYDTHLTPLTNTDTTYRMSVAPTPESLAILSRELGQEQWKTAQQVLSGGMPTVIPLDEPIDSLSGMVLFQVPVRYSGPLPASHLLGYLDNEENHGVTGVEKWFDDRLNEYAGEIRVTYQMNGTGEWLQGISPDIENTMDRCRGGVALTLDSRVQAIAQRAADRYLPKGAAVVCDADTGQILATVSTPGFQPDTVADVLHDDRSPLLDRTICNYNCGSVFKIVTAAAALEANVPITAAYSCSGRITVEGISFGCHHALGHGRVSMMSGFAESCNPYFIQLAQDVGGERLHQMASSLGFDRALSLVGGPATATAVLPRKQTLAASALANLSIGQGELLASPLHMAALIGAVVNDGEWRPPSIYKGDVSPDGKLTEQALPSTHRVFSPKTAEILRQMMVQTVKVGTGKSATPAVGGAGGKTGTAETGWASEGEPVVQSWFAGFYPAEDPQYVIVTLAEDADNTGGDSSLAFRQICEQLASL